MRTRTPIEAKDFSRLLGMDGFSDNLLKDHFALYEGYVKNVNLLHDLSESTEVGSVQSAELRRRFGWEWNGMRLHELYFENLTKTPTRLTPSPETTKTISERFGSFEAWESDFRSAAMTRGIGWIMLVRNPSDNGLFNIWIDEHDKGHLSGTEPILVMDVFEHAFIRDYGLKRADYVESFMRAIDWETVSSRLSR